jgi:hypothetical protein
MKLVQNIQAKLKKYQKLGWQSKLLPHPSRYQKHSITISLLLVSILLLSSDIVLTENGPEYYLKPTNSMFSLKTPSVDTV